MCARSTSIRRRLRKIAQKAFWSVALRFQQLNASWPSRQFRCLRVFSRRTRFTSKAFALSNSARREALSPLPARLMKYVSIRMPEPGPFGETFFDASALAIVGALFVNNPVGGCVESVLTPSIHLRFPEGFLLTAIRVSPDLRRHV